jgi:class 3 adenylate cyclase
MMKAITDGRGWQWPFRYKLCVAMSLIVVALLLGMVLILENLIEKDAIRRIELDLQNTGKLVSGLIENRNQQLFELATGLGGSELIRVVLTDGELDRLTCDDIIANEILPNYPRISILGVSDHQGSIRGSNITKADLGERILRTRAFQIALSGDPGKGFIYFQEQYIQIAVLPLLIGPAEQSELMGIVVVGMEWSAEDLEQIGRLGQASIALLHNEEFFLATGDLTVDRLQLNPQSSTGEFINALSTQVPQTRQLDDERFLFLKLAAEDDYTPAFVVAKSLDQQMAFMADIQRAMIRFGLVGIGLGLLLSFALALGISRPIQKLRTAAGHIARGRYDHRVHIHTRDEFAHLARAFNQMAQGLGERDYIRDTFGRYIDDDVARNLLQRPETAKLGGERRTVVILMADIRGFTPLSETLSPEVIIRILNQYFTHMIQVIKSHQGIIVDFVGDALLAFFNPLGGSIGSIVPNAVRCAFEMHGQLHVLNEELVKDSLPKLAMGIGLNVGPAIVGNIGSDTRAKYGIVGSAVNITQRIQGQALAGEVVVSDDVLRHTGDDFHIERSFESRLKGVTMPRQLHAVHPRTNT